MVWGEQRSNRRRNSGEDTSSAAEALIGFRRDQARGGRHKVEMAYICCTSLETAQAGMASAEGGHRRQLAGLLNPACHVTPRQVEYGSRLDTGGSIDMLCSCCTPTSYSAELVPM